MTYAPNIIVYYNNRQAKSLVSAAYEHKLND